MTKSLKFTPMSTSHHLTLGNLPFWIMNLVQKMKSPGPNFRIPGLSMILFLMLKVTLTKGPSTQLWICQTTMIPLHSTSTQHPGNFHPTTPFPQMLTGLLSNPTLVGHPSLPFKTPSRSPPDMALLLPPKLSQEAF